MKLLVLLFLAGCAEIPVRRAEPVTRSRVIVHEPTRTVPFRWTTEIALRPDQETLYHEGRVIPPAPEVWLNGVRQ